VTLAKPIRALALRPVNACVALAFSAWPFLNEMSLSRRSGKEGLDLTLWSSVYRLVGMHAWLNNQHLSIGGIAKMTVVPLTTVRLINLKSLARVRSAADGYGLRFAFMTLVLLACLSLLSCAHHSAQIHVGTATGLKSPPERLSFYDVPFR
jgi:hypothetical protein